MENNNENSNEKSNENIYANAALRSIDEFAGNEDGMGTIEVILIIVVLIGLVIIFQTQLKGLVERVFKKINSGADKIIS